MRTNNWEGIEIKTIGQSKQYKFEYNKAKSALKTLIPLAIAMAMVIIKFAANITFFPTVDILYFALVIIMLFTTFLCGCRWILNSILGDNITEKSNINLKESKDEKNKNRN